MATALEQHQPIKDPIRVSSSDTDAGKEMKRLVIAMTKPRADDRPSMEKVESSLLQIQGTHMFVYFQFSDEAQTF